MEYTMKHIWGEAFACLGRQWWRMLVILLGMWAILVICSVGVVSGVATSSPKFPMPAMQTTHVQQVMHVSTRGMKAGSQQAMVVHKRWQVHFCSVQSLAHMREKGVPAGSLVMMGCSDRDLIAAGFNPLDITFSLKEMGWFDKVVGKVMIFIFMHQHFPGWAFIVLGLMGYVFMGIAGYWCFHIALMDLKSQPVDLWVSLRVVLSRLHHVLSYMLLSFALILIGFVCLVVPGILLMVYLVPGFAFVLLERQNAIEAIKSSVSLVRGQWWFTFGVNWIPGLFVALLVFVLHWLGRQLGMGAFAGVFNGVIHLIYYVYIFALAPSLYLALCARKDRSTNP